MHKGHVLIVEDLPDVRAKLSGLLLDAGYIVRSASSRIEALELLHSERFHVAVLDVRLDETDEGNQDGLVLMHEIKETQPSVAVVILTGYANVKMVREALQPDHEGTSPAFAFLEKSEFDQLLNCVKRAFEHVTQCGISALCDMIAEGENDRVEFKSSMRWDREKATINKSLREPIAVAVAGMLNGKGGTLLIGVADDGTVLGIQRDLQTLHKKNIDGFQLALTDIVQTYLGVECTPYIQTRFERINNRLICVVSVEKSPKPVFSVMGTAHKFWVRTGNSTRSLDVKETMEYIRTNWQDPR